MFEKLKISDEVDYIPFEVDGVELKKTEILFTNEEVLRRKRIAQDVPGIFREQGTSENEQFFTGAAQ